MLPGLHGQSALRLPGQERHGRRHFEICKIRLQLDGKASPIEPFPDRPQRMHRKRYERMKARALELEMDLPPKLRGKTVDYRNLVYYAP